MQITNCHTHLFTVNHVPARFAGVLGRFVRFGLLRRLSLFVLRHLDPFSRRDLLERWARIVDISYKRSQADIFDIVRGFYPENSRFVILPMDMELMGAGPVPEPIAEQHAQLRDLRDQFPDAVIPFAAVDPRREDIVETTKSLVEEHGFRGLKLYPPLGYFPTDPRLEPLYEYAAERSIPILAHCSRGGVYYRGELTEEMLVHPITGERLDASKERDEFTDYFTDPDNYVPILERHPSARICLAHFGGAGDWKRYIEEEWHPGRDPHERSWLAKILDLIRSGEYPNLYTDIAYTLFVDASYAHTLKVVMEHEAVRNRVLFGSDFYVVEQAELAERETSIRIRSVLGEDLYRAIAEENPRRFLGEI